MTGSEAAPLGGETRDSPSSKGTASMGTWAEDAIENACRRAQRWFECLRPFPKRVNLRSVVGHKRPAILSEQDCVMNFARFLNEEGVPWDAVHHQVAVSRWLFEKPHPAATAGLSKRWCVDLAILSVEDFLAAQLPATTPGFQFDACLEFAYLSDSYTLQMFTPTVNLKRVVRRCN